MGHDAEIASTEQSPSSLAFPKEALAATVAACWLLSEPDKWQLAEAAAAIALGGQEEVTICNFHGLRVALSYCSSLQYCSEINFIKL